MLKDFYIRMAVQDDLLDMQTILLSSSRDWSPYVLRSCFGHDYKQWIIGFKGTALGFAIVKENGTYWEIMQIVTDSGYQRQGLATRLLQHVILEARKNCVTKIQLEVRSNNFAAIRLYQKCRFEQVGVRKNYYAGEDDALLMDCVL